jgi:hypothetical protein
VILRTQTACLFEHNTLPIEKLLWVNIFTSILNTSGSFNNKPKSNFPTEISNLKFQAQFHIYFYLILNWMGSFVVRKEMPALKHHNESYKTVCVCHHSCLSNIGTFHQKSTKQLSYKKDIQVSTMKHPDLSYRVSTIKCLDFGDVLNMGKYFSLDVKGLLCSTEVQIPTQILGYLRGQFGVNQQYSHRSVLIF